MIAELEPPSTAAVDDASYATQVDRIMAMTHLPVSAHVALIGHHTLPCLLALLKQTGKVDRVDIKGRETAIAYRISDDLTREGEQKPWAFDHHHRGGLFSRNILQTENAAIGQFHLKQQLRGFTGLSNQNQLDFIIGFRQSAGVYIDVDRYGRRLLLWRK